MKLLTVLEQALFHRENTISKLSRFIKPGAQRLLLAAILLSSLVAKAESLVVPNHSFESPATTFVDTRVDSWQKFSKPFWYDESGGYYWDQLIGGFKNSTPDKADHIDNVEGDQVLYLFAVPQVGILQDYAAMDWAHQTPNHEFTSKFEVGKSYHLTVGVVGGGGGMLEGAGLQLGFYYRNTGGDVQPFASIPVTYTKAVFPTTSHLVDFTVDLATVKSTDAWAGQHIGMMIVSAGDPSLAGGYWDLDNVRLTAEPSSEIKLTFQRVGSNVQLSWLSATNSSYQVKISEDLQTWTNYQDRVVGTGGAIVKTIPPLERLNAFFTVITSPNP